jgi:hypothetical protein
MVGRRLPYSLRFRLSSLAGRAGRWQSLLEPLEILCSSDLMLDTALVLPPASFGAKVEIAMAGQDAPP